jgi:mRNA interferase HigB
MVIITKGAIYAFAAKHPLAKIPLNDWFEKTKEAQWKNFAAVRLTFNSADGIGNDRYVFNVGGNHYRIVSMIHFNIRTIYIRAILTRAEYDALNKLNRQINL